MHSAFYTGTVTHSRTSPATYSFTYRVFMTLLDLDELERGALDRWPVFSSSSPRALAAFRRSHHMIHDAPSRPLSAAVRDFVAQRSHGARPRGPIWLLTNLTVCGLGFNPVSFYYVMDDDGRNVEAVIEEVNNIPWFEQHCYLMRPDNSTRTVGGNVPESFGTQEKQFHVSPFIAIDGMRYHWSFSRPGDTIVAKGNLTHSNSKFFHASLNLTRRYPFSVWSALYMLARYPLMTVQVVAAIHYEAAKLWLRNFTFYDNPSETTTPFLRVVEAVAGVVARVTGMSAPEAKKADPPKESAAR